MIIAQRVERNLAQVFNIEVLQPRHEFIRIFRNFLDSVLTCSSSAQPNLGEVLLQTPP